MNVDDNCDDDDRNWRFLGTKHDLVFRERKDSEERSIKELLYTYTKLSTSFKAFIKNY